MSNGRTVEGWAAFTEQDKGARVFVRVAAVDLIDKAGSGAGVYLASGSRVVVQESPVEVMGTISDVEHRAQEKPEPEEALYGGARGGGKAYLACQPANTALLGRRASDRPG